MSMKFEKILFPTDFSDLSRAALRHARELVEAFEANLHCLHVVDDAYQYWSAMGPESIPVGPPPEDLLELARTRMDQFRGEHLAGLKKEPITHVTMGRPFAEIIAYARENEICLIVMGTHGRGAFAHVLLGSTTEKVVRKAPCAVMTVRAPDHDFVMP
ncbi:MAG: universal stress protein [Phycisphaerales bacterium]|nr:MAG: universal stress protein [Phycisphaerales bacterium]